MGKVSYTHLAREDLLDIWAHIARQSTSVADRIYDRIQENCDLLRDRPQLGPARPEIADQARVLVIDRWLVLYRPLDYGVQMVRIVDGARDLAKIAWTPE